MNLIKLGLDLFAIGNPQISFIKKKKTKKGKWTLPVFLIN